MKYFQRLIKQMEDLVETSKPGKVVEPPSLLSQVTIDDNRLSYFQMGLSNEGTKVIMIHGFGGFFMEWAPVMLPIARKHHVYALDLPGWGFSELPDDVTGVEDHVRIIKRFVEELKLEKVILIGISYGAAICWASAASKAFEIERMFLLNPMPPFPLEHFSSPLYKLIFNMNRNKFIATVAHKALTRFGYKMTVYENVEHNDKVDPLYVNLGFLLIKQPQVMMSMYHFGHLAKNIDWQCWIDRLHEIDIPVSLIKGKQDKVFNMESVALLKKHLPHADVIEIDGSGHAMVFDRPIKVAKYILRALGEI